MTASAPLLPRSLLLGNPSRAAPLLSPDGRRISFIAPLDGVPDILPMLGFADDAAMLAAALRLVAGHITPDHQRKAQDALLRVMAVMRRR